MKNYKVFINAFLLMLFAILMPACYNDLDIEPKNVITDENLLGNAEDVEVYMSRMYSLMPFEDFKYMGEWGFEQDGWLNSVGISGTGEAVNRDGITTAFTGENTPYWGQAFELIRDANHLIDVLPEYKENYSEEDFNHFLGEAYYIRAFVYTAMAKRFGGVPLVTEEIKYQPDTDSLEMEVPRSSEEDTWNQILEDYDKAIELLKEDSPKSGYANKYVALAFKSEAMLYAGSVAKYNENVSGRLTGKGDKTGVRVIGFSSDSWSDASKRYFSQAYSAANKIIESGKYDLYKKKWAPNDKEAQYENMVEMFSDMDSPENIYVRDFDYPTMTHGFDAYNLPYIFRSPLSAGTCPTVDFVELFDGFDRYPDGSLKVTTGDSNSEGDYLMFDDPMDFFAEAEPRLRAYVLFPGDKFRGEKIEVRAGVYTGSSPIHPLFDDYSYQNTDTRYQNLNIYTQEDKKLYLSPREGGAQEKVEYNGSEMTAAGENGPFYDNPEATITGFYIRKWLNDDPSSDVGEGKSDQPFILMRYGEVLLNAAEAGIELALAGETPEDGTAPVEVANKAIEDIRERAGADPLSHPLLADTESRNIIRKERLKELAFERKNKWALRRWRVLHADGRDGFWGIEKDKNTFSNGENYRFRGLYPFFSTDNGKYFFDATFQWISTKTFSYKPLDYYFGIPAGEVSKSSVIDQQPNR